MTVGVGSSGALVAFQAQRRGTMVGAVTFSGMELNPVDLGDIAAWVAAAIALLALGVAGWNAKSASQAKTAAQDSAHQARRSADASEDSASSSQRSADAAEEQNRLTQEQDARYDPIWEIRPGGDAGLGGLSCAAVNRTGETAYSVTLSGEGIEQQDTPGAVLDGGSVKFIYYPKVVRPGDAEVVVSWRRPEYRGSEGQEWRGSPYTF